MRIWRFSLSRAPFYKTKIWIYLSLVEFMFIGGLISFIEHYYQRLWEAPTVGLTMILCGIIVLMFYRLQWITRFTIKASLVLRAVCTVKSYILVGIFLRCLTLLFMTAFVMKPPLLEGKYSTSKTSKFWLEIFSTGILIDKRSPIRMFVFPGVKSSIWIAGSL